MQASLSNRVASGTAVLLLLFGNPSKGQSRLPLPLTIQPGAVWRDKQDDIIQAHGPRTYHSQTAYILPVTGSRETSYIYLGDRWNGHDLKDSRYVWLPLLVNARRRTMALTPDAPWTLDAATDFCSLPVSIVVPPAPPVLRGHP